MKPSEIRALSAAEIKAKVNELREEAMNLRFQDVSGQLTDYSRVREVRRDPFVVLSEAVVRKRQHPRRQCRDAVGGYGDIAASEQFDARRD